MMRSFGDFPSEWPKCRTPMGPAASIEWHYSEYSGRDNDYIIPEHL